MDNFWKFQNIEKIQSQTSIIRKADDSLALHPIRCFTKYIIFLHRHPVITFPSLGHRIIREMFILEIPF